MTKLGKKFGFLFTLVAFGLVPTLTTANPFIRLRTDESLRDLRLRPGQLPGDDSGLYFTAELECPGTWMIQTNQTDIDPEFLTQLSGLGIQPLPIYIPDQAILAYVPDCDLISTLFSLLDSTGEPLVYAAGPYQPAYKIDPLIGRTPITNPVVLADRATGEVCEPEGCTPTYSGPGGLVDIQACTCTNAPPRYHVAIEVLPGCGPEEVEIALSQLGAEHIQTLPRGDTFRIHAKATEFQYERIAFERCTHYVTEIPEITLHNDIAVGTVQSGDPALTPLWDQLPRGLHGEGQIVGHIDNPIDMLSGFFRCDTNVDPDCDNSPGPHHRKIVGYDDNPIWQFTSELFSFTSQIFEVLPCAPDCGSTDFEFINTAGETKNLDPGAWWHGTHTAAIVAGDRSPFINQSTNKNGHAYKARLFHTDLDQIATIVGQNYVDPYGTDPYRITLYEALQHAYDAGARVFSNSWGQNSDSIFEHGSYSYWSEDADKFAYDHEDALVIFSASNYNFTTNPENAKNILSVGASHNGANAHMIYKGQDGIAHTGPTFDGRRKPEIFAPGADEDGVEGGVEGINSAKSSPGTGTPTTIKKDGTSMATAAVAGAAALVRQYFVEGWYPSGTPDPENAEFMNPSGALLKAMLLNSTVNMEGPEYPTDEEGWGLLRLDEALYFDSDGPDGPEPGDSRKLLVLQDKENRAGFSDDNSLTYRINVPEGSSEPLKITLVFTEPPATPAVAVATVHDLDLVVTAPSGTFYRGNVFDTASGVSSPSPTAEPDNKNNVEMVIINNPEPGIWYLKTEGKTVHARVDGVKQGAALVVTGEGISQYVHDLPSRGGGTSTRPPRDILSRDTSTNIRFR